jgi:hypothetical protein
VGHAFNQFLLPGEVRKGDGYIHKKPSGQPKAMTWLSAIQLGIGIGGRMTEVDMSATIDGIPSEGSGSWRRPMQQTR